jgi:hypothetical protein
MPLLYSFVRNTTQVADLSRLTDSDAVELIPQYPIAQSLYSLLRAQGYSVVAALTELLKIQLASGGQRNLSTYGKRAELMDGDRTWQEQLDAFMQSEQAETVVRPGSEGMFARQVDTFVRTLNLDEWEAYPEYIDEQLSSFLEHELDAGRLAPPNLDELGLDPGLWETLQAIAITALEARFTAEVVRGVREDMRAPQEEERATAITEGPRSLAERVQDVMWMIKDFVHGRDAPEDSNDLGR